MLDVDEETLLPVMPPHKALSLLRRWESWGGELGDAWWNRILEGWQFEPFGFDVPEAGEEFLIENYSDPADSRSAVVYTLGVGAETSWLDLPLPGAMTSETLPYYLARDGGLAGAFFELDIVPVSAMRWIVWRMFQYRIAEFIWSCFHYRPRAGSGNFDNHPERRFVYPGHPEWTP